MIYIVLELPPCLLYLYDLRNFHFLVISESPLTMTDKYWYCGISIKLSMNFCNLPLRLILVRSMEHENGVRSPELNADSKESRLDAFSLGMIVKR